MLLHLILSCISLLIVRGYLYEQSVIFFYGTYIKELELTKSVMFVY